MFAVGCAHAIAARRPRPDTMLAHDPFDPLAADGLVCGAQFGMDARRSVSFLVRCMNPPDIGQQIAIGDLARAVRPRPPRVVARRRHAQRLAHNPHRPDTLVVLDQAEPHLGGSEKMATAFFKTVNTRDYVTSKLGTEAAKAAAAWIDEQQGRDVELFDAILAEDDPASGPWLVSN